MSDTARDQALAQVASIVEMVNATRVDYDRLEELRDKRAEGHYTAGWNMPGYMPDSEPAGFDTDDEANAYLADEMERHAEEMDAPRAALLDAAEDLRLESGEYGQTIGGWHYWSAFQPNTLADPSEAEELADLEAQAGECTSEDDAWQRIDEDPLSVEFRSGWSDSREDLQPEEFRIVLCTGGPHVELRGELDSDSTCRVRVLFKDWGESGELFDLTPEDCDALITYCDRFLGC